MRSKTIEYGGWVSYWALPRATVKRSRRSMRERFTSGSVPFRKAYLQSLIDVVEVDDRQIRIKGSTDVLERAVLAGQAADESGSHMSTRWRASQNKTANTYVIEIAI
jgi:hypothetical protein